MKKRSGIITSLVVLYLLESLEIPTYSRTKKKEERDKKNPDKQNSKTTI